jgi:hypothetical protein
MPLISPQNPGRFEFRSLFGRIALPQTISLLRLNLQQHAKQNQKSPQEMTLGAAYRLCENIASHDLRTQGCYLKSSQVLLTKQALEERRRYRALQYLTNVEAPLFQKTLYHPLEISCV